LSGSRAYRCETVPTSEATNASALTPRPTAVIVELASDFVRIF